jgi:hypothetical protein
VARTAFLPDPSPCAASEHDGVLDEAAVCLCRYCDAFADARLWRECWLEFQRCFGQLGLGFRKRKFRLWFRDLGIRQRHGRLRSVRDRG